MKTKNKFENLPHWVLKKWQNITNALAETIGITESKQTEIVLLDSREFLLNAFINSPLMKSLSNLSTGKYVDVNDSFCRVSEFSKEEVIGKTAIELGWISKDERMQLMQKVQRDGSVNGIELLLRSKNGKSIIARYWGTVVHSAQGDMLYSAAEDITERKEVEAALQDSEKRFRNILQDIKSVAVQGYAPDGITTYWNKASEILYGFTAQEAIGRNLLDLIIPAEMKDHVSEGIKWMEETGQPVPSSELVLKRKDGSSVSVYSHHTIVQVPGRAQELFCIDIDLTERVQAEEKILELNRGLDLRVKQRTEELEKANEELEAFSYSVSHDLKAPLRHISGFIQLFLENKPKDLSDEQLGFLEVISTSASDMEKLIDGILTFSRLNSVGLQETRIRSSEMVQKVISFFDPETQNRKITFHVEPLPEVNGDEDLIRQVWTNLISNAIKYTSKKPEAVIEIGAVSNDSEITFYLKDNGAGFDMNYAEKLFGVFQRLHKTRDFEGVGIGLANVNRIVTRHGGHCRAEGEEDKGATFYFSLPK
ncbi:MAG: PAS domain S-box protein [Bacteroidales bacterium]